MIFLKQGTDSTGRKYHFVCEESEVDEELHYTCTNYGISCEDIDRKRGSRR